MFLEGLARLEVPFTSTRRHGRYLSDWVIGAVLGLQVDPWIQMPLSLRHGGLVSLGPRHGLAWNLWHGSCVYVLWSLCR